MNSIVIKKIGGPEVLEIQSSEVPSPGEDEILVKVHFSGINFADLMARQGLYPDCPPLPVVVGYEVSGIVMAHGSKVGADSPKVGTRVVAMTRFGGYASHVCTKAHLVFSLPDNVSLETAAALPVNGLTAYHMLYNVAHLKDGSRVLIHQASGGVGTIAMQLCKLHENVEVFGTASSAKHELIKSLGCTHPIDYRTQDYAKVIKESGQGVDIVLDAIGEFTKGATLLRTAGTLVCFGAANMSTADGKRSVMNVAKTWWGMKNFSPLQLMDKNISVAGTNVGHMWDDAHILIPAFKKLIELTSQGKIKPIVEDDAIFHFKKASDAHAFIHARKNRGKVLLKFIDEQADEK